jgi:hypothetical protein
VFSRVTDTEIRVRRKESGTWRRVGGYLARRHAHAGREVFTRPRARARPETTPGRWWNSSDPRLVRRVLNIDTWNNLGMIRSDDPRGAGICKAGSGVVWYKMGLLKIMGARPRRSIDSAAGKVVRRRASSEASTWRSAGRRDTPPQRRDERSS